MKLLSKELTVFNLIDTHAHLDFSQFDKDREKIIKELEELDIKVINVGSHKQACLDSIELAKKHKNIYAAVGIHPHDAEEVKDIPELIKFLKSLVKKDKVIAIGECGLDYYSFDQGKFRKDLNPETKNKQKEVFKAQLEFAQKIKLPVIIHNRESHDDLLRIIKDFKGKGVIHCFSGDKKFLKEVLGLGFYIGFDGNITFKNAQDLQEIVKATPIDRILIETDCPFLTPEPFRGLRNEPKNVKITAEFIAELKQLSFSKLIPILNKNTKNLFGI